jgi:DNA-binding CsgD family transcriptional regulator
MEGNEMYYGTRMLQEHHIAVLEARSVEDYQKMVVKYGRSLGFNTVSAMAVVDHSLTHTAFFNVDNAPSAYLDAYHDVELCQRCPVMQHCKRSSIPIVWDQATYTSNGHSNLWETHAKFGYKTGIALALHFPGDRHFCIGVDRDQQLNQSRRQLTRIVADLQLYAVHAQESAFKIFCPPPEEDPHSLRLTPRELEALRWTMDGRTARDVGEALNISERTAVFHLQNAIRKLGCSTKHHAVLKAMRLGLLS